MQRVIERYRAYVGHLTALVAHTSTLSVERARLSGYLRKWQKANILIGTALYVDVLKPPSLLSQDFARG